MSSAWPSRREASSQRRLLKANFLVNATAFSRITDLRVELILLNRLLFIESENSLRSPTRPGILQVARTDPNAQIKKLGSAKTSSSNFLINVDIETQTEWSWLQDMQLIQRIKKG